MQSPLVVMVAGEASGDQHGAHLIRELKKRRPDLRVAAVGGRAMQAAGAEIVIPADRLSVVGVTEVVAKIPRLVSAMTELKRLLVRAHPDLLILIDFPDFNLHLAAAAKRAGIPVLYYISPQIWAWRAGRVKKIRARVDHMAVILPFEAEFYARHGIPVSFVGHPLMDAPENSAAPPPCSSRPPIVALLPGSRDREVARLLPEMLKSAALLKRSHAGLRFMVSRAPTIAPAMIRDIVDRAGPADLEITDEPVHSLFSRCRVAVAASGTVTLEAALCGTPTVIAYKVSPLSYLLGRLMIRVQHIGLANLIAGGRLMPELIQHQATAAAIAREVRTLLSDPALYANACTGLGEVRRKLGHAGASGRVADLACSLMEKRHAV